MSENDSKFLDVFSTWLGRLGQDVGLLTDVLESGEASDEAKNAAATGLLYLFKSLDLIEDGIEGLGFLDDAFVVRVAAARAPSEEQLAGLAEEAALVREFLGDDYARLEVYVSALSELKVRGRTVEAILEDDGTREETVADARGWVNRYEAPQFTSDPKNLVKLRSFLSTKLPEAH